MELSREQLLESVHESKTLAGKKNAALQSNLTKMEAEVEGAAAKSNRALSVVDTMITHCSQESRSTILELRGGLLEKMDLVSAVDVSVNPLAEECGAELVLEVTGRPVRLSLTAERNLLYLIKEAVSNAARHASPSKIEIRVSFLEDQLQVEIQDNGCGFDIEALPKAGRFGLQGMRERAKQLGAEIRIDSKVAEGSLVSLQIQSLKEWQVS